MPDSNLEKWKDKYVFELVSRERILFPEERAERHRIYSLALMAITFFYWNGNKYGRKFQYPLNEPVPASGASRLANDYLGHNIACLIVDGDGLIIDFEFNHNEIFNSSVEHAESRLLRRVFSLSQIHDSWDLGKKLEERNYSSQLKKASLYTTLESCAQCSGIMALAQLKEVIFLQTDPGQYSVGNIMRNMTESTPLQSPLPIPADWIGLDHFEKLDQAYREFQNRPKDKEHAMVLDLAGNLVEGTSETASITSFLCTKSARDIFEESIPLLDNFVVKYPIWKPDASDTRQLSNAEVMVEAKQFVTYATRVAKRGTPHRA